MNEFILVLYDGAEEWIDSVLVANLIGGWESNMSLQMYYSCFNSTNSKAKQSSNELYAFEELHLCLSM